MDLPYFFEKNIPHLQQSFYVSAETHKHCAQVLRMKEGNNLLLTNGKGILCNGIITECNKKSTLVKIIQLTEIPQPEKKITIALSLLKNTARFEWFLEKATELGIYEIIPLLCKRTEKQHFRQERMQQITIAAMLQSKQCWLPVLQMPTPFQDVLLQQQKCKLIAHCYTAKKLNIQNFSSEKEICILIGPEGDFTEEEVAEATQKQYMPITLGNTRLRTETAGIVAATLSILN